MMSDTAFAAVMFPSCAARPVSLLVLTGSTITGALMVGPAFAAASGRESFLLPLAVFERLGAAQVLSPPAFAALPGPKSHRFAFAGEGREGRANSYGWPPVILFDFREELKLLATPCFLVAWSDLETRVRGVSEDESPVAARWKAGSGRGIFVR